MKQVAANLDRNTRRRYLFTLILFNDREKADFDTIKESSSAKEQSILNSLSNKEQSSRQRRMLLLNESPAYVDSQPSRLERLAMSLEENYKIEAAKKVGHRSLDAKQIRTKPVFQKPPFQDRDQISCPDLV